MIVNFILLLRTSAMRSESLILKSRKRTSDIKEECAGRKFLMIVAGMLNLEKQPLSWGLLERERQHS